MSNQHPNCPFKSCDGPRVRLLYSNEYVHCECIAADRSGRQPSAERYMTYVRARAEIKQSTAISAPTKKPSYLVIDHQGAGKTLCARLLQLHLGVENVFEDFEEQVWPDDMPESSLALTSGNPAGVPDDVLVLSLADALRLVIEKLEASSAQRAASSMRP